MPITLSSEDDLVLSLDAFIRSIAVRLNTPHAVFLGAGGSVSSGVPSAQQCIWEWKRSIFLTNNPGLENQFTELSLASVQRKIQQWLDRQKSYPREGAPDEYGFYIKNCFPIVGDRRAFFANIIRKARPHTGYRLLCHLAQIDLIRSVWGTNFDGLPARAVANFPLSPIEVGIDSQHRLPRTLAKGELLCVSMHGDYRYDDLKNTSEELQQQEASLRAVLVDELRNTPFIVCGYSGRDQSVMEAFHAAYARQGSGSLYWCGFSDLDIPNHIADLIHYARRNGHQAYYVPTQGFDDVFTRISLHCLTGEAREAAIQAISEVAPTDALHRSPFVIPHARAKTLIKSNAFEIECPAEVIQFQLDNWPEERAWKWVRETVSDWPIVAVPFNGKVLAFGSINNIKNAFGENIKGRPERAPISPDELHYETGAIVSLMLQALVRSMADNAHIYTDGRRELWRSSAMKAIQKEGMSYNLFESMLLFLRRVGGLQYVILKPSIKVFDKEGKEAPLEIANPIKLSILGYQHNKEFNQAMKKWRQLLLPKNGNQRTVAFEFPANCGSTFQFQVRRAPTFAEVGVPQGGSSTAVPDKVRAFVKHRGIELGEPALVFATKDAARRATDTHPIRGIVTNRPFDYPLTQRGLAKSVRLGIICPRAETQVLRSYLYTAQQTHKPSQKERDYLVDYPGFERAYGLPIEIPEPGDAGWVNCAEPSTDDPVKGPVELAGHINRAVEALQSSHAPHVVLIFFPDRWRNFRGYRKDNEAFDIHDFVKAYCVQRGVATQFLNQDTLSESYPCRVWWWLSLALYVKSMRTPWVLDSLDRDTAYIGLGYSMDRVAENGKHIVVGCSHIYSARGEGLQYRLSKVENPIIKQRNPFLSKDDARRTGEAIRQLFFEARMRLPHRVVIHKRTPFLKEEREGLLDGLSGVDCIEMLEIQVDRALRYVASIMRLNGTIDEDNYPVRRSTVVKLDDYSALLWVHGATAALNPRLNYFQGKKRIPAPLFLRRHAGSSELKLLAEEILALSKMNWNTFDLYSKLPATLQSSNDIARIGSLLERFGASSYDYRLFI